MNPHVKEAWFVHYLEETRYPGGWQDMGIGVEVGGLGLIICTINVGVAYSGTIGFRIIDENNEVLMPYRTKNNNRNPTHFSMYPHARTYEDQTPVTFHMIANCKYAKLQVLVKTIPASYARTMITNSIDPPADRTFNHKPISTMTAIPLVPFYQPGANTVFTYPQSRMPRTPRMPDKPPVIHKDKSSNLLKKDSA